MQDIHNYNEQEYPYMEDNQNKDQKATQPMLRFINKSKQHLENDVEDKYIVIKAVNMVRSKMGMPPMTEEEIKKYIF